ncbi:MAG: hypothetical protein KGD63_09560 [Candidatus Lokiarchaeota archaeon]|nr:hypothetical protein [Candidatus Lokiarchaeota archaeon]
MGNKINVIIIGINTDFSEEIIQNIDCTKVKKFTEKHGGIYFESSVNSVDNVEEVIIEFTRRIMYSRK